MNFFTTEYYMNELTKCFNLIKGHYKNNTTERSGIFLMNHITEGLKVLDYLKADITTKAAFCLHPLMQSDLDFYKYITNLKKYRNISQKTQALTLEYRRAANSYLCTPYTDNYDFNDIDNNVKIVLEETKLMLIADKVQNYKDFLLYHYGIHERSNQLNQYFINWLSYLGIDNSELINIRNAINNEFFMETIYE